MTASDHPKQRIDSSSGDQIPEDLRRNYELFRRVSNKEKDAHVTFGYVQELIERIAKAETALAQKTRECEELRDNLRQMTYCRDDLNRLVAQREAQVEQLGRQVAEMSKEVTEEEFDEYFHMQFGSSRDVATINEINALLASRARTK